MNIISAREAYQLSFPNNTEKALEQLDSLIKIAAARGEASIRIPYDLCLVKGYSIELRNKLVEESLTNAGYRLTPRSEDRQFVDVWLELSWGR
jgi:hypothetical protein